MPLSTVRGTKINYSHEGVEILGGSPHFGDGRYIALKGNYAYVTHSYSDILYTHNIANPKAPACLGSVSMGQQYPLEPCISGSYMFVPCADDNLFKCLDLTDSPGTPVVRSQVSGAGSPNYLSSVKSIATRGSYAFCASYADNAVSVFDFSDLGSVTHVGLISGTTNFNGPAAISVKGDYAYVACQDGDNLSIVDISNPESPTFKAKISGAGSPNYLDGANQIDMKGSYACVTTLNDNSMVIIDCTQPGTPVKKSVIKNQLKNPVNIRVSGNYAYIVDCWAGAGPRYQIKVVDISDVSNPFICGSITGKGSPNYLDFCYDVAVNSSYLYAVSSPPDDALTIFKQGSVIPLSLSSKRTLSRKRSPIASKRAWLDVVHIGQISGAGSPNYLGGARGIYVSGSYAYVASNTDGYLSIFDISDPSNPTLTGSVAIGAGPLSVHVSGDYAYVVASDNDLLVIVDVSNPGSPESIATFGGAGSPNYMDTPTDVFVSGNYAYVVSYIDDSLTVVDVSTPSSPTLAGVISGAGSPNYLDGAYGVHVSGNYAYVAW